MENKLDRDLIKRVAAPTATPDQLETFLYLATQYNLDPLKKEIYFINQGGKPLIMTSRDGYLKIAQSDQQFDGIESDVVYEGDRLSRRDDGSILIAYGQEHLNFEPGKLRGAFSNVFRKDRAKAAASLVSLKEYYKESSPVWKSYTHAMILKVAESMALKRGMAITGLVTQEEMGEDESK